ncbi:hypothetical protein F4Y59_06655 [Candidatus Poribacteria bacterium]|nr:hypothetical protein [Candidatus Poribacteria bacterium]MYK20260.1 hypothetical protein [Candidatus Poribacteria bacterium]
MKRSAFKKRHLVLLAAVIALFIGFTLRGPAQEETGTLSGRVVDLDGNPVAGLSIYVAPSRLDDGHLDRVFLPYEYSQLRRARTDAEGRFSITDIPQGPLHFGALPDNIDNLLPRNFEKILKSDPHTQDANAFGMEPDDFEPDLEVLSLRIQDITFYARDDFSPIAFGVKPGTHIDNVIVTVHPRMRIRGRILFKDGTPLSNARVRLHFRSYDVNETGSRQSGGDPRTDAEGYFIYYLDEKDDAAFYTFSVAYRTLSAEAEAVRLEPEERFEGLTLTFDSEPILPEPPRTTAVDGSELASEQESDGMWIVNPTNGHAYKRVSCETRDAAVARAADEKAHLVTINDAEEQAWLEAVFGHKFYWIGLSNTETAGQWQWDNGEPVAYENWVPDDFFSEASDVGGRDYAVMTFFDGKWYAVNPGSVILHMTEMALLEKGIKDQK